MKTYKLKNINKCPGCKSKDIGYSEVGDGIFVPVCNTCGTTGWYGNTTGGHWINPNNPNTKNTFMAYINKYKVDKSKMNRFWYSESAFKRDQTERYVKADGVYKLYTDWTKGHNSESVYNDSVLVYETYDKPVVCFDSLLMYMECINLIETVKTTESLKQDGKQFHTLWYSKSLADWHDKLRADDYSRTAITLAEIDGKMVRYTEWNTRKGFVCDREDAILIYASYEKPKVKVY